MRLAGAAGQSDVIAALTVGGADAISQAGEAIDEYRLPVFELGDDLYEAGRLRAVVFQMRVPHSWQAWRLARYFGPGDRAYKKVGLVRESSALGEIAASALKVALEERGLVFADVAFPAGASEDDIAGQMEGGLAVQAPEAVVLEGTESFLERAAAVMGDERRRYRGRSQIHDGWHPQLGGFDGLLFVDEPLPEGTVSSGDYAHAFSAADSIARVREFRREFRQMFGRPPRGDEALAYDSVRLVSEAVRRAGDLDRGAISRALESLDRQQYAHLPVSWGPDDHVGAERDVLGLWTQPFGSRRGIPQMERWYHLMRTFTSDLERTNILEEDWPSFFQGTTPGGEAPFFHQARSGVVSGREDQTH